MLKERRRYFRQPIKMQVQVVFEGKTLNATSTNISEGGIALMLREAVPKGAAPHPQVLAARAAHPKLKSKPKSHGATFKGLAGFPLSQCSEKFAEAELERWLDERMEQNFPAAKERLAAAGTIRDQVTKAVPAQEISSA